MNFIARHFSGDDYLVVKTNVIYGLIFSFSDMLISSIYYTMVATRLGLGYSDILLLVLANAVTVMLLDYPTSQIGDNSNKLLLAILGLATMTGGLTFYFLAPSFLFAIIGIIIKSLGESVLSGLVSSWMTSRIKQNENYQTAIADIVKRVSFLRNAGVFLSLGLCLALQRINPVLVVAVYLLINCINIFLLVKNYRLTNSYTVSLKISPKNLISYYNEHMAKRANLLIIIQSVLGTIFFVMFISTWQLIAIQLHVESYTALYSLLSFGLMMGYTYNLKKIPQRVNIFLLVALSALAFLLLFKLNWLSFALLCLVFQIIIAGARNNTSISVFAMVPDAKDHNKYFSLISTYTGFVELVLILVFQVFFRHIDALTVLRIAPFVVLAYCLLSLAILAQIKSHTAALQV